MTHTPTQERDWESRFDATFVLNENLCCNGDYCRARCAEETGESIKHFILETLQQDRAYLAGEVGKLKKDDGRKPHELYGQSLAAPSHIDTFNLAVSQALSIINGSD